MALSDVIVTIDLIKPLGSIGFGIPLILEENASTAKSYTECRNLDDIVKAGFADSTKVYKAANTIFMQDDPPEKIAVCATTEDTSKWLTDVANTTKNWRQLIVVTESETAIAVQTIMNTVETLPSKLYFADLALDDDTVFNTAEIKRTVLFYCKPTELHPSPVSALIGATASKNAGSFTYKNMILKGIEPQELTETQVEAIHEKGGNTFITKAGDNVTSEGKVAGGEFIDVIDSMDYVINNIEYQTQKLLNSSDKVPYDDNGIALLESVAVNVLKDAFNNGIIAVTDDGTPDYKVNYVKRANTKDTDRAERNYVGGQFEFALAGAVHAVRVIGKVNI